jgi:hypothetical protein
MQSTMYKGWPWFKHLLTTKDPEMCFISFIHVSNIRFSKAKSFHSHVLNFITINHQFLCLLIIYYYKICSWPLIPKSHLLCSFHQTSVKNNSLRIIAKMFLLLIPMPTFPLLIYHIISYLSIVNWIELLFKIGLVGFYHLFFAWNTCVSQSSLDLFL